MITLWNLVIGILLIVIVLAGFLGIFLPFLPGVPLVWFAIFLYAYWTNFAFISMKVVIIFLLVTVCSLIIDIILPLLGAKRYGATTYGTIGAFVGFFVGFLQLGIIGVVLGPFLGALIGELIGGATSVNALRVARGTVIGFFGSALLKLIISLTMIAFVLTRFISMFFAPGYL